MATSNSALGARNLGAVSQLLVLLSTQLRLLAMSRKTRALLAIQLVPVLGAFVYVMFEEVDGLTMFTGIVESIVVPFLVPLAAIFFGGPAIVDEMEGRTLTYLTLRPVGKGTLFVGKALAGTAMAVPLVVLPVLALFGICLWQSSDYGETLQTLPKILGALAVGTATYTAIFATLGAAFASTLLASIVYFVVFEMVIGALPVLELLSMRYHIRGMAGLSATDRLGILDRMVLEEPLVFEWWVGLSIMAAVAVVALAAGTWIFRERQYYV